MTQGLLELGEVLLASSRRRLETVSRNVANATTPGYKSEIDFEQVQSAEASNTARSNLDAGPLRLTQGRFDFAIAGDGFFQVRAGEQLLYTRAGAFHRDTEGRLADAAGAILQSMDGGDLIVAADADISADGVVSERGAPIARIGIFAPFEDATLTRVSGLYFQTDAISPIENAQIRPGMLEGANVALASEMLDMMTAIRGAEIGARVVQTYDTLIGQTISTFTRRQG